MPTPLVKEDRGLDYGRMIFTNGSPITLFLVTGIFWISLIGLLSNGDDFEGQMFSLILLIVSLLLMIKWFRDWVSSERGTD